MIELLDALHAGSMMLYSLAMENPLLQQLCEILANSPLAALATQLAAQLAEAGQGIAQGIDLPSDLFGQS